VPGWQAGAAGSSDQAVSAPVPHGTMDHPPVNAGQRTEQQVVGEGTERGTRYHRRQDLAERRAMCLANNGAQCSADLTFQQYTR
jgi:hypothetical protein